MSVSTRGRRGGGQGRRMARFRRGVLMNESRVYFETSEKAECASLLLVPSVSFLALSLSLFLARLSPEEKKLA